MHGCKQSVHNRRFYNVFYRHVRAGARDRRPQHHASHCQDLGNPAKHDVHSKPDLYGGCRGDRYPSCEQVGERKFLSKGTRYEIHPVDHMGDGKVLHIHASTRSVAETEVYTSRATRFAMDPLCLRMAWTLSQTFVVSAHGFGMDDGTVLWPTYYDIPARSALSILRDARHKEMYNPWLGRYRFSTGSSSRDYRKRFPNVNYARGLVQLFCVGLDL